MTNLTPQQQTILSFCKDHEGLVLIDAVAGSGKTTMLKAIATHVPNSNSLYLAYNKAIADESKGKFPRSVSCSTTHSLAYKAVVPALKLRIASSFNSRDITEKISSDARLDVVSYLQKFFLSSYLDWDTFASDLGINPRISSICHSYIDRMYSGAIPCTHDFYLKVFHIWLVNGYVTYSQPFDIIMLDEAGDLNRVTMEIFRALPGVLKIAVGDQHQNIYTFNHTINCFAELHSEGTMFPMTQSFRVNPALAEQIQVYGRKHLSPSFTFLGAPQNRAIRSYAYIARTNASLVARMIELNATGTPYSLARSADEIFRLPRMLCFLKPGGFISDPTYRHLQEDVDNYYAMDTVRSMYPSMYSYLHALHGEDDIALSNALNLILRFSKIKVLDAYAEAKKHESLKHCPLLLCTAHSSKGLEYDSVTLADDMDRSLMRSLERITKSKETEADYENLNLYYVACTRASIELHNATYLETLWNRSHTSRTKRPRTLTQPDSGSQI